MVAVEGSVVRRVLAVAGDGAGIERFWASNASATMMAAPPDEVTIPTDGPPTLLVAV
jgi:hypothetical protein